MYPAYGFAKHKGYGTAFHIEAIRENGLCSIHRRSFIKNIADKNGKTYFTKNYTEHNKKVQELKDSGMWFTYE